MILFLLSRSYCRALTGLGLELRELHLPLPLSAGTKDVLSTWPYIRIINTSLGFFFFLECLKFFSCKSVAGNSELCGTWDRSLTLGLCSRCSFVLHCLTSVGHHSSVHSVPSEPSFPPNSFSTECEVRQYPVCRQLTTPEGLSTVTMPPFPQGLIVRCVCECFYIGSFLSCRSQCQNSKMLWAAAWSSSGCLTCGL